MLLVVCLLSVLCLCNLSDIAERTVWTWSVTGQLGEQWDVVTRPDKAHRLRLQQRYSMTCSIRQRMGVHVQNKPWCAPIRRHQMLRVGTYNYVQCPSYDRCWQTQSCTKFIRRLVLTDAIMYDVHCSRNAEPHFTATCTNRQCVVMCWRDVNTIRWSATLRNDSEIVAYDVITQNGHW